MWCVTCLEQFVQFKKREKRTWSSFTLSKVAGLSLPLFWMAHSSKGVCTNGTHVFQVVQMVPIRAKHHIQCFTDNLSPKLDSFWPNRFWWIPFVFIQTNVFSAIYMEQYTKFQIIFYFASIKLHIFSNPPYGGPFLIDLALKKIRRIVFFSPNDLIVFERSLIDHWVRWGVFRMT